MKGAALMSASMAAFTINDTCLKVLGETLPLFQFLVLRSLGVTILLVGVVLAVGAWRQPVSRRDWTLIAIRTVAEVAAAWTFITALIHMPIANLSAILQALPLTVTLAAALFLGEPVGWKRFAAIAIGFAGVYLIVRPGGDGFTEWSVLGLASVVFVTVRDLAARRLSPDVPSLLVAFSTAAGVLVFSGVGALFTDWQPMVTADWGLLTGAVLFVMVGYLASVSAMRVGEIGFVAPFRYASLIVALILGFLVFGDWPDAMTLVGASIVVATGLFTLWRERALRRAFAAKQVVKGPGAAI